MQSEFKRRKLSEDERRLIRNLGGDIHRRPEVYQEAGRWLDRRFGYEACFRRLVDSLRLYPHGRGFLRSYWTYLRNPPSKLPVFTAGERTRARTERSEARRLVLGRWGRFQAALHYYLDSDALDAMPQKDACRIALLSALLLYPEAQELPELTDFQQAWDWDDEDGFCGREKIEAGRLTELFGTRRDIWNGLSYEQRDKWLALTKEAWDVLRYLRDRAGPSAEADGSHGAAADASAPGRLKEDRHVEPGQPQQKNRPGPDRINLSEAQKRVKLLGEWKDVAENDRKVEHRKDRLTQAQFAQSKDICLTRLRAMQAWYRGWRKKGKFPHDPRTLKDETLNELFG